jgi:hypothetical protein
MWFSASGLSTSDTNVIIRDAPDIRLDHPAFFTSGIRPDTGFDLPDIRPDTENQFV